jgi:hypothetical protein
MDRIGAWSRAGKVCLWSPRLSWLVPLASRSVGAVSFTLVAAYQWAGRLGIFGEAVPLGPELTGDLRCRFVQGDFFALAASEAGFDPAVPARRFDAVLVDIDHSPDFLLDPQNAAFYGEQGLSRLAAHLRPGGIFALWSNDRLDDAFTARLRRIFADARAEEVTFHNPL